MFTIFITHTSFQLYHCLFPRGYLESIHTRPQVSTASDTTASDTNPDSPDNTASETPVSPDTTTSAVPVSGPSDTTASSAVIATAIKGVTLRSTWLYDFCDVDERGEWLDVLVALIEYLRSGESKVGYLNKYLERNMLHRSVEEKVNQGEIAAAIGEIPGATETQETAVGIVAGSESESAVPQVVADETVSGPRRSARKRAVESGAEMERKDLMEERNTKVRRVGR